MGERGNDGQGKHLLNRFSQVRRLELWSIEEVLVIHGINFFSIRYAWWLSGRLQSRRGREFLPRRLV